MNPFLDSLVGKSLVNVNGAPKYVSAVKAGKAALREAPKHKSLKGVTPKDANAASEHKGFTEFMRGILRNGGRVEEGVQLKVGAMKNNRITVEHDIPGVQGFHAPIPVPGKGQRDAHHVIGLRSAETASHREATLAHEMEHSRGRRPLSRQMRHMRSDKVWGDEARADSAMPKGTPSAYEDAARYKGTVGNLPDSSKGRKRYLAIRRKINAAKGTKGTDPIVSKGFPTHAMLHGLPGNPARGVRVVGMIDKDTFRVLHGNDYIVAPRHRLTFTKGPKLSKPKKPKPPKQLSLIDSKGRINPNAKP